ncbi:hypothetical protein INR49_014059, partial [Caranx melampygus]
MFSQCHDQPPLPCHHPGPVCCWLSPGLCARGCGATRGLDGLVYCCCYELYAGYVRERLRTDMQDIPGNYLSRPDDCFWVAVAEVDGRVEIMGMVAVMAKQSGEGKMAQIVVDFCRERGIPKVVLETSSTQMAAVALYKKLGFRHILSHTRTVVP